MLCTVCTLTLFQISNSSIALNLRKLHLESCLDIEEKHIGVSSFLFFDHVNNMLFKNKIFLCWKNFAHLEIDKCLSKFILNSLLWIFKREQVL
jgi:hypothetical protein